MWSLLGLYATFTNSSDVRASSESTRMTNEQTSYPTYLDTPPLLTKPTSNTSGIVMAGADDKTKLPFVGDPEITILSTNSVFRAQLPSVQWLTI